MTPADLSRLSTLLDEALDLPVPERETWLARLEGEAAALAPKLRDLLARHASKETAELLERGPAFELPGAGPAAGDAVGPYRLLSELGSGGMGAVWLAERADGSLKRKVALKLPHMTWAPGLAERFAREREILASLEHPHIARLYDAGLDAQGRPFMALEYVEGQPIDVYCRERAIAIPQRLRLLLQVAEAVAFAHGRLVLHRDLKPANILVTADGQVRLLDFGVAKLMQGDSAAETALTQASGRALTLDYASPEQIRGEPLGTASDVYSLGVVAFELLAGTRPYRLKRGSAAELEEAITGQDVPLASAVAQDAAAAKALRGDLDAILNKALKKGAAERYTTIDALAQDWRRHLEGQTVSARPETLIDRLIRVVRRHRVPLAAGSLAMAVFVLAIGFGATAVVILALLLGMGAALWQARRATLARDKAQSLADRNDAVAEFLNTFLTTAARAGEPITPEQLLDRAEAMTERDFSDRPEHLASVLAMMGTNAQSLGNSAKGARLAERALAVLRDTKDVDLRDAITCQHAMMIGSMGRVSEAEAVLKQVLSRSSTEPDRRAEAYHYLAYLARQRNDAVAARHNATEALRWYRASRSRPAMMEASLLASLGGACALSGQNEQADQHYAAAIAKFERLGKERGGNAIAVLSNWAQMVERAGDLPRALGVNQRALDATTGASDDAPRSPVLALNRARILDLMGRSEEAKAGYEEVLSLARATGMMPAAQYAVAGLASLAVARGDAATAEAWLADAAEIPPPAAGSPQSQLRLLVQGELALLRCERDAAAALFGEVIDPRQRVANTAMGLLGRAEVDRQAGRLEEALAGAREALTLADALRIGGAPSVRAGLAALAVARLLTAAGDAAGARQHAAMAVEQLAPNVHGAHPGLAEARSLARAAARAVPSAPKGR